MRRCIFTECRRRSGDKFGKIKSYHRFPREAAVMTQWVTWVREACGMYNFELNLSSSSLCSRHFTADSFRESGRLHPDALPSITPYELHEAENAHSSGQSNHEISCFYFVGSDAEENDRTHNLGTMTQEATPLTLKSSDDKEHADISPDQPVVYLEKVHGVTDVIVEVKGDGEGSIPIPELKTRKKFPIDLCPDDFRNCQKAERNLKLLNFALSKIQTRLHAQSKRIQRVTKSLSEVSRLIQTLRKEEMVTEEGQLELDSAVNNILDYVKCKKVH